MGQCQAIPEDGGMLEEHLTHDGPVEPRARQAVLIRQVRKGSVGAALELVSTNDTLDLTDLSTVRLGARGGRTLGAALASETCVVRVLKLKSHHLMERGLHFQFRPFAEGVGKNATLRELHVVHDLIDDFAARDLATAIAGHPTLRVLNLSHNRIGGTCAGAGYKALADALPTSLITDVYVAKNCAEGLPQFLAKLAASPAYRRVTMEVYGGGGSDVAKAGTTTTARDDAEFRKGPVVVRKLVSGRENPKGTREITVYFTHYKGAPACLDPRLRRAPPVGPLEEEAKEESVPPESSSEERSTVAPLVPRVQGYVPVVAASCVVVPAE